MIDKVGYSGLIQPKDETRLKKAASQFEEFFVKLMLKEANKKIFSDSEKKKDALDPMYNDMIQENLAKQITRSRTLGIAQKVYNSIKEKHTT